MKIFHPNILITTLVFIIIVGSISGQHAFNPKTIVPFDPAYKMGTLPNGIKYILRGDLPEKKAYCYAFYNVGSIQEEPKEYGLAHLLEHLCFYDKKKYIDYFQGKGMIMGEYINARTLYENTRFTIFGVPVQEEGIVDTALLFLRDLSFTLNIRPQDLNKERKIVLEEWRLNQDAATRIDNKIDALALKGSKYSRPNIDGDTAVINHCTVIDVKNFFQKWYRPDHLTIIVIGGFEVSRMEAKVKQLFSTVPNAEGKSPRIAYTIPENKEVNINIVTDPEATSSEIKIHYRHNQPIAYNQLQLKTEYVDKLIDKMFENRLEKITVSSNSPFTEASAKYNINYFKTPIYDEYSFTVKTNKDIKTALKGILTENDRIIKYGFTKTELQNAKNILIKNYGPNKKEYKLPYDEYFIQCYYFILTGKTVPSYDFRRIFVNKILPSMTLEEVNKRFKSYTSNIQPVITISCPQKEMSTIPSVTEIKNIIKSVPLQKIETYTNPLINSKIFDKKVNPGLVLREIMNSEMAATEWFLSNGIHVILKSTDFSTDDIQFQLFRNNFPLFTLKDEYITTLLKGTYSLKKMGVDKFSDNEIKQLLNGKKVSVEPVLATSRPGIYGNSSLKDIVTALQLIHLFFSNQRWDTNVLTKDLQVYSNFRDTPMQAFRDSIKKYINVGTEILSTSNLSVVTIEKIKIIHKYIFNDPAQFTFMLTGNFSYKDLKPLIEKYIGSLNINNDTIIQKEIFSDSTKFKIHSNNNNTWYSTGRKSCEFFYPMQTPIASVNICIQGKLPNKPSISLYKNMAQDLLVKQCENSVRYKYGASYRVAPFQERWDGSYYWHGSVYFQTDPKTVEYIKDVAMNEVKSFMEGNIKEDEFNNWKHNLISKRSADLRSNLWWINYALPEFYFNNKNIIPGYTQEVKNLTLEELKSFTRFIYDQGNIIDIIMKPQ